MVICLASFKSRLVLAFWYQLTQVVLERRPFKWVWLNSSCILCGEINSFHIVSNCISVYYFSKGK